MGHAFNQTIMDALTRYHRMRGYNTLWLPGTDHAGIATQIVVERQLERAGRLAPRPRPRDRFIERVWEWKEQSGSTITRQMRRIGASCDWAREYFTMDAKLSRRRRRDLRAPVRAGPDLPRQAAGQLGPEAQTAVSDLEVESEEEDGKLWHIRYPRSDGKGHIVVATTRPETMLGDAAVAVHPEDERYRDLVGRRSCCRSPAAPSRSSPTTTSTASSAPGCVKITPAHDFNDWQVGQRHGLPAINVLTLDAKINDNGPEAYRGLDRFEARKQHRRRPRGARACSKQSSRTR